MDTLGAVVSLKDVAFADAPVPMWHGDGNLILHKMVEMAPYWNGASRKPGR